MQLRMPRRLECATQTYLVGSDSDKKKQTKQQENKLEEQINNILRISLFKNKIVLVQHGKKEKQIWSK